MLFVLANFRDNPALLYRSAQTRLFAIHKEQQGASREKYAPLVRTAVRARGRRHVPVNLSLCLGSNFARLLMHSAYDEFFVKTNRNYQRRYCMYIGDDCAWSGVITRQPRVAVP